jgi:adenine-specific DNA-methyltransferase
MVFQDKQSESTNAGGTAPGSSISKAGNATPSPGSPAMVLRPGNKVEPHDIVDKDHALWHGDALAFLKGLPKEPMFDLVVTSPPYNIGKEYETRRGLHEYL